MDDFADIDDALQQAKSRIAGEIPLLLAIYVFGSTASGERTSQSDLDLAVLVSQPIDPVKIYDLARSLEVELDLDVDLVDLQSASTVLTYQIITKGRLLFNADHLAVLDFEARSLSEYGHFRERIAPLYDQVRETGQAYAR